MSSGVEVVFGFEGSNTVLVQKVGAAADPNES